MAKKRAFISGILLLSLCLGFSGGVAQAREHTLYRIDRSREEGRTHFELIFSAVPEYEVKTSGQRLDVILYRTGVAESMDKLEAGVELARSLLAEQGEKTIVSLVLRRPPADVEYSTAKDPSVLRLRLSWPGEGEQTRPAIAKELGGELSVGRRGVSMSRRVDSPYREDWMAFFREYELPLRVDPDLVYTFPPFPGFLRPGDLESLPEKMLDSGEKGEWAEALGALDQAQSGDASDRERLPATIARVDLLLRQGKTGEGRRILRMLPVRNQEGYKEVLDYLGAYAAASAGNPYLGYARARDMSFSDDAPGQWKSYAKLLEIETALGTGHAERAYALASDPPDKDFPDRKIFALRKAQAAFATGKQKRAVRDLKSFPRVLLRNHPRALAQLARYSYENGNYGDALQLYSRLANSLPDRDWERVAMARFGEAMSDLQRGAGLLGKVSLMRITDESGDCRARWRAETELADLAVLNKDDADANDLARAYHNIAQRAGSRAIREEAAFKRILVAHLNGHDRAAVHWLAPFLREHSAGKLQSHARVLLVDILPGVVRELLEKDAYIRAMALVQKNRESLRHARLPLDFLYDLGGAFSRLGFFDRASRVYEYMMSLAGNPEKREDVFPLLARSYLRREEYSRSADLAEKYLEEYPGGAHQKAMYFMLVKSLRKAGQTERAAGLLRSPDRPVSRKLDAQAGRLLFSMERFGEAQRYLARATGTRWRKASPELLLQSAECLYRTGVFSQALPLYSFLEQQGYQADQARYRMGQIRMKTDREEEGTKLWQRIVDRNESPLWSDLAEEGMAIEALRKRDD
ncbi:MAG: hypothetical protein K9J48_00870 [Desulfohalobiaceae bacterium]|nr:hypothetical protein [Desulfohalobiaceae bacterium]